MADFDNRIITLLKRLAWYYDVNDCQERDLDDTLDVSINDLKEAFEAVRRLGEQPHP